MNGLCREFRGTNVRRMELEGRMTFGSEFRLNDTELGVRESRSRNLDSQLYGNERERDCRTLTLERS